MWSDIIQGFVILAALLAIPTYLGYTVNGRVVSRRVWAWLQRSRKEREAWQQRVATLEDKFVVLDASLSAIGESFGTEVNKLKDQTAGLKQRMDEYSLRLSGVDSYKVNNALEFDALSTKQKQLEALVTSREQMLTEARDQITDIRRVIAETDRANVRVFDQVAERLKSLEQRIDHLTGEYRADNT